MKILLGVFIVLLPLNLAGQQKFDVEYVVKIFNEKASRINKIEYEMHRIDTFPGNIVWDNSGIALIERNKTDDILGFSFYGKQHNMAAIYDARTGFIIDDSTQSYEVMKVGRGFLGTQGGQMILPNIFYLDSVYQTRSLLVSDTLFTITYRFRDDTLHDVTNITRTIDISRHSFNPVKSVRVAYQQGRKITTTMVLGNFKINEHTTSSISAIKTSLTNYSLVQQEAEKPNPILGTQLPTLHVFSLFKPTEMITIKPNKPLLIDFWENWCGPCITSLPKVENIYQKYRNKIEVIGIIFQNREEATRLLGKKKITFTNAMAEVNLKTTFGINSWPRYFLVDRNGVILKEYRSYSEQIEKDIELLVD